MKFGMNMLLWTDDPTKEEYLPVFERLKKIGFDGVELPIFNLDPTASPPWASASMISDSNAPA